VKGDGYDWVKLPVVLKRFPLQHKLAWCYRYAQTVCPGWRYDAVALKSTPHPLPWELNIIAMLSVYGVEYDNRARARISSATVPDFAIAREGFLSGLQRGS